MKRYFGLFIFLIGLGILVSVFYLRSKRSQQTYIFSPYTILTSSWEKYKTRFINQDGRVIDYKQGDVTTSEGQSYALLQAVWIDDKATFDQVWRWTKNTLKRPNDHLFGWRWGKLSDKDYGFMDNGGDNSAADADSDIALALILAHRRWRQQEYLDAALPILNDLWNLETAEVQGKRYVTAGNWAIAEDRIVINPSYFAPYAWRIFATVDKEHDWNSLIDPGYEILTQATTQPLDTHETHGLPPDWVSISKYDGSLSAVNLPNLTTNYSFDAMRIPWRIALDYQWNQEPRAKQYLNLLSFLNRSYIQEGRLYGGYSHDGKPLVQTESPVMYATALGYFIHENSDTANSIYQDKILKLYSNDTNSFRDDLPYYESNWLWFGSALFTRFVIPFSS